MTIDVEFRPITSWPGDLTASRKMSLRYFTDQFDNLYQHSYADGWEANLRAIALGLEALRKVERYGIAKRAEQYTGYSALPPGTIEARAAEMTVEQAIKFLDKYAPGTWDWDDEAAVNEAFRRAAKILHPDVARRSTTRPQRCAMTWQTTRCNWCSKNLLWAVTDNGKAMPVDPEIAANGNVMVWREGGRVRAKVIGNERPMLEPDGAEYHQPHFASCPGYKAARHRPKDT